MHIIPVEIIGKREEKVRAEPGYGSGVVAAGGRKVSKHRGKVRKGAMGETVGQNTPGNHPKTENWRLGLLSRFGSGWQPRRFGSALGRVATRQSGSKATANAPQTIAGNSWPGTIANVLISQYFTKKPRALATLVASQSFLSKITFLKKIAKFSDDKTRSFR